MTQLPPDDREWQEFLCKHRPTPPPASADFEEQLMQAVEKSPQPAINQWLWTSPPMLAKHAVKLTAAGLLMVWSGYRLLIPLPQPSNAASLEAFLENNWNEVLGETSTTSQTSTQTDWILEASAAR